MDDATPQTQRTLDALAKLQKAQPEDVQVSAEDMRAYTRSMILCLIRMNDGIAGRERFASLLREALKHV